MAKYKLSPGAQKLISSAIDNLFEKAKIRFLGAPNDKRLVVTATPDFSLPGLFTAAARNHNVRANSETLEDLLRIAGLYIDGTRERTKAQVIKAIQSTLADAKKKRKQPEPMRDILERELTQVWEKAQTQMRAIAEVETQTAKNMSVLDGILHINAENSIQDPVVYFVVVKDRDLCEECRRLHLMPNGRTPRLWYMSEIGHSYHKKGDDHPKMSGLHPHCRCSLLTLLPGYSFDSGGNVQFFQRGWQEIDYQRGKVKKPKPVKKSEEPLDKVVLDPNAGYSFEHKTTTFTNPYETDPARQRYEVVTVKARDASGKLAGQAHLYHHPTELEAGSVQVNPEHRRKGLASAMYTFAEKQMGKKIVPSKSQTKDGQALWQGNQDQKQFGKSEEPLDKPEFEANLTKAVNYNSAEFRQWFGESKLVHPETKKPLVLYRGARHPDHLAHGHLKLPSYTDSPDVASIYAGTPADPLSSLKERRSHHFGPTASVLPVHIRMHNPLDLTGSNSLPDVTFRQYLAAMKYGQSGGMTHEEACKVLNYLVNREKGKVPHGPFEYKIHDPYEDDEDRGFSLRSKLADFRSEFQDYDDHIDAMHHAGSLHVDSFALVDAPRTKEVGARLGHDGVIHNDIVNSGYPAKELLGKQPHEVIGAKPRMEGGFTHKTYRPFEPHQVKSIHNDGTFGQADHDMLKSEPEWEELHKAEWYWKNLRRKFEDFGWVQAERSKHTVMVNPYLPNEPWVTIKRGHMAGPIDPEAVDAMYAKPMGLRVRHSGTDVEVDPRHPHAHHYKKLGLWDGSPEGAAPVVSWTPTTPHQHVHMDEIEHVSLDGKDAWKPPMWHKKMKEEPAKVPPVKLRRSPAGKYQIVEGHDRIEGARLSEFTHVPAEVVS